MPSNDEEATRIQTYLGVGRDITASGENNNTRIAGMETTTNEHDTQRQGHQHHSHNDQSFKAIINNPFQTDRSRKIIGIAAFIIFGLACIVLMAIYVPKSHESHTQSSSSASSTSPSIISTLSSPSVVSAATTPFSTTSSSLIESSESTPFSTLAAQTGPKQETMAPDTTTPTTQSTTAATSTANAPTAGTTTVTNTDFSSAPWTSVCSWGCPGWQCTDISGCADPYPCETPAMTCGSTGVYN